MLYSICSIVATILYSKMMVLVLMSIFLVSIFFSLNVNPIAYV